MPTARAQELGVRPEGGRRASHHERSPEPSQTPAILVAGALLLACLYAAFDHGGVGAAGQERVQVGLAAVAAVAAAAWLWTGALSLRAAPIVWAAVGLLAAFAAWSAVTLAWSVAPDQTWIESNRAIGYVLVLVLAIAVGASHARGSEAVGYGFLGVVLAVTAYALAQKLLPGLRVGGLLNLDRTASLPRLQEPLGYWNALALLIAMGVPIAFSLVVQRRRHARVRLAALVAVALMLETIAFTYSRGGVLALACALAAGMVLSGTRLRYLMWLGLVCLASAPPIVIGLISHKLTAAGVSLGTRELAGLELSALLIACLLLLVLAARRLMYLERRARVSAIGTRRIGRALVALAAAALAIAVLAVALSPRGLGGSVSHAWSSFTTTRATSVTSPSRLLSADSENRWVWWKEAAGAFSDRPLGGWGAGSFGVVHLLYRRDTLSVQQPHSVPLQLLAETGIVGALMVLVAFALLLRGGVAAARRRATEQGRLLAAALVAGAVAYAVHALYDWDWNIPALTLPVLVLLGTLGGSLGRTRPAFAPVTRPAPARGPWTAHRDLARGVGVAVSVLCLSAFAVSVVVPRLAATKASQALTATAASSHDLRPALASALDASKLDPLSDAGLRAASTIALRLGRPADARRFLLEALSREPSDGQAWQQLAFEDFAAGSDREALVAGQRVRALDPRGPHAVALAQGALLTLAPPAGSAAAAATPP